jgi:hypothetical protein
MTIDELRSALRRTLRSYGIDDEDFLDELAAIADHHAAEEAAVAASEIARLAERCHATYDWKFQPQPFGALIRSGAAAPPWIRPLSADGDGDAA